MALLLCPVLSLGNQPADEGKKGQTDLTGNLCFTALLVYCVYAVVYDVVYWCGLLVYWFTGVVFWFTGVVYWFTGVVYWFTGVVYWCCLLVY